jgi:CheY-like chemotaxis protein
MQDVDVNLIITDYCMPGMTGYDLLRKIKVGWHILQDFFKFLYVNFLFD